MPYRTPALHDGLDLLSVPFKQWVNDARGVNYGWKSSPIKTRLTIWQRIKAPSSLIGSHVPTPDWPVFRGPPTVWQRILEDTDADLDPAALLSPGG